MCSPSATSATEPNHRPPAILGHHHHGADRDDGPRFPFVSLVRCAKKMCEWRWFSMNENAWMNS
jgi:hypothetical protein